MHNKTKGVHQQLFKIKYFYIAHINNNNLNKIASLYINKKQKNFRKQIWNKENVKWLKLKFLCTFENNWRFKNNNSNNLNKYIYKLGKWNIFYTIVVVAFVFVSDEMFRTESESRIVDVCQLRNLIRYQTLTLYIFAFLFRKYWLICF